MNAITFIPRSDQSAEDLELAGWRIRCDVRDYVRRARSHPDLIDWEDIGTALSDLGNLYADCGPGRG